jgi:hypothetical protein
MKTMSDNILLIFRFSINNKIKHKDCNNVAPCIESQMVCFVFLSLSFASIVLSHIPHQWRVGANGDCSSCWTIDNWEREPPHFTLNSKIIENRVGVIFLNFAQYSTKKYNKD